MQGIILISLFFRAKLCPHPMPWLLTSEVLGGQGWPMSQGCLLLFKKKISVKLSLRFSSLNSLLLK